MKFKGCFLSHDGYHIPLTSITKSDLKQIKQDLTVKPSGLDFSGDTDKTYTVFNITDKDIIVPRYYGEKEIGIIEHSTSNMVEPLTLTFNGTLRDYQKPVVEKCLEHIKTKGGGLLSVPCAFGKTSCAIYMACALKVKTLVIVHKSALLKQWEDRLKFFTNIQNVGILQGNKSDIDDSDIVVGMIHTISQKNYEDGFFNKFGFVVFDESHHSPSRMFSRTLMKTGCPYTLALSATPYRNDGLIKIMHWFLGETIYRIKGRKNDLVVAKQFKFFIKHKEFREKKAWFKGQMLANTAKMMKGFRTIPERLTYMVNVINSIRKDKQRKILILSDTIESLKLLKTEIDNKIKIDIKNKKLIEDEIKTRFYIGTMKDEGRKEAEDNGDIIFATGQMAKEGLDIPRINTVVMASSQKDVVQTVGRAMRKLLKIGDLKPLIIDFVDDVSVFSKHAEIRENFYLKYKYKFEPYYLIGTKFVTKNEYLLKKRGSTQTYGEYLLEKIKDITIDDREYFNDIKKKMDEYLNFKHNDYDSRTFVDLVSYDQKNMFEDGGLSDSSNSSSSSDSSSEPNNKLKNEGDFDWNSRLF